MDVFWTDQHLELAAGLLDLFDIPVTFNAGTSVMQQPGLGSKLGEMSRQIEHALLRGQYDWVVVQGNLLARIGRLEARTGRYRKTAPFRTAGPRTVAVPLKANQDRRHHIPKQRHRVTNWAAFDIALRRRRSLTVWFTEGAIAA